MRQRGVAAILVAGLILGGWGGARSLAAEGGDAKEAKVLELFDQGLKHYRVGEYRQAGEKFTRVLELKPDEDLALIMRQRATVGQMVTMMAKPELREQMRTLLRLSQQALEKKQRSPKEIRALIAQFTHKELPKRWLAKQHLIAAGPYAVPFLLEHLDVERQATYPLTPSERVAARAMAQRTLEEMGTRAVLPLIEALKSPSVGLRIEVCRLLARQADARSIPALRRLVEEAKAPPRLRDAARRALAAAAGRAGVSPDRPALEAALSLAESYYYRDPRIVDHVPGLQRVIWNWNAAGESYDQRIVYRFVPQYAYNELMAEKLICEALGIGADTAGLPEWLVGAQRLAPAAPRRRLLALLAANGYGQLIEARDLAAGAPVLGADESSEKGRAEAAARAKALERVHLLNRLIGSPALHDALARHLKDAHYARALEAIADLRALADRSIPAAENALLRALRVGSPPVRFAATEALLHIAPDGSMGGTKEAVANVIAACHTQTLPNVAVVTQDTPLFHGIAAALRSVNCTSEQVKSVSLALARTRNQLPFVSMILLDTRAADLPLETAVATLRQDALTQFMPLVLLSPPTQVEPQRKALGKAVFDVVSLRARPETLAGVVKSAFEMPSRAAEAVKAERRRLIAILDAVAALAPGTRYPIQAAGPAISDLLLKHPDEVRVPAAHALEAIGVPAAFRRLAALFLDAGLAEELRVAAGRAAVSAVLASSPEAPARLTAEQRRQVLALCRDEKASEALRATAVRLFAVIAP